MRTCEPSKAMRAAGEDLRGREIRVCLNFQAGGIGVKHIKKIGGIFMLYNPTYEKYTTSDGIFTITHTIPKLKPNEKQKVKSDIENKLFDVFKNYIMAQNTMNRS